MFNSVISWSCQDPDAFIQKERKLKDRKLHRPEIHVVVISLRIGVKS